MPIPPIISTLGDAFAALCVVAIVPWILGVPGDPGEPGNESAYARGWKMGLIVVCIYPIARALNVLSVWGVRWVADAPAQMRWESISQIFGAFIFLVALLRLGWAIRIFSKG